MTDESENSVASRPKTASKAGGTFAQQRMDIPAGPPRKKMAVRLVGKEYLVDPPKGAAALRMARIAKELGANPSPEDMGEMMDVLDGWITKAFGPKAKEVLARLDDWDDQLDLDHIMVLMQRIMAVQGGNPTTSSSDSSES